MTGKERVLGVSRMVMSRNAGTGVRINNHRLKSHRFTLTKRQIYLIIFLLLLFIGTSLGYVWSSFERTQIGYDLSRLKTKEMELKELNRKLRLELAVLKSPQNLEKIAVQKLGLRQPSPEQIIVLP
jgi:cell division protein FtsL